MSVITVISVMCAAVLFVEMFFNFAKNRPNHSGTLPPLAWLESMHSICIIVFLSVSFLSDPGPIIVYACQSLTNSLTHDLVEN